MKKEQHYILFILKFLKMYTHLPNGSKYDTGLEMDFRFVS